MSAETVLYRRISLLCHKQLSFVRFYRSFIIYDFTVVIKRRYYGCIKDAFPDVDRIYTEKFTGTKIERPEFEKLLKRIRPGDTIIFDSVSRMS